MSHNVVAELVGTIHSVDVAAGDTVEIGDTVVILESMKMEIPVLAEVKGVVARDRRGQGRQRHGRRRHRRHRHVNERTLT